MPLSKEQQESASRKACVERARFARAAVKIKSDACLRDETAVARRRTRQPSLVPRRPRLGGPAHLAGPLRTHYRPSSPVTRESIVVFSSCIGPGQGPRRSRGRLNASSVHVACSVWFRVRLIEKGVWR
jgi:hypothetical protein